MPAAEVQEPEARSGIGVKIGNGVLLVLGVAGAATMVVALAVAFFGPRNAHIPMVSGQPPNASPSESRIPFPFEVAKTRTYNFSKASDLKAFKKAGFGTVEISDGKRLRLSSYPASKLSVSMTVTVAQGSELSFDDEQSGSVDYDSVNFFIDGRAYKNIKGNWAGSAKYQVYPLEQGKHTLTWQLYTDKTVNLPTDAYYLDNVKITKVVPESYVRKYGV